MLLAVLAACAAAILAGCGGGQSTSSSSTGDGSAKPDVSLKGAKPGGSLSVGLAGPIANLDPNTSSAAQEDVMFWLLWDGLTRWSPEMKIEPDLATSWSHSPDLKTWTFKLRHGVEYSDGRPFTAEDAVKNIERVLDPKTAAVNYNSLKVIKKVTAPNAYELVLQLASPNAFMPETVVNVHMTDLDRPTDLLTKDPNGTGPYMVQDFVPNDHVDLVPNPNYWGPKPLLDQITLSNVQDSTSGLAAVKGGQLDVLWGVNYQDAKTLSSDQELEIIKPATVSANVIWEVDTTSPPFDDVKARQALSYAIDRQQILEIAYGGQGTVSLENNQIAEGNPVYDDSLPKYEFNLDKAKELFAEADVTAGTKLTYWAVAGAFPEWVTAGEILQQDLKKIGIDLEIKTSEFQTWINRFYPAGKKYPGLIAANYLSNSPVPPYIFSFFEKGTCECNWDNPELPGLLKKGVAAATLKEQREAYAPVQRLIAEQAPVMTLLQSVVVSVKRSNVLGVWTDSAGDLHLERTGVS
ncbi:MAG: ABC transporter substrate-binding protein [Solirubrobacterales bacterium]